MVVILRYCVYDDTVYLMILCIDVRVPPKLITSQYCTMYSGIVHVKKVDGLPSTPPPPPHKEDHATEDENGYWWLFAIRICVFYHITHTTVNRAMCMWSMLIHPNVSFQLCIENSRHHWRSLHMKIPPQQRKWMEHGVTRISGSKLTRPTYYKGKWIWMW